MSEPEDMTWFWPTSFGVARFYKAWRVIEKVTPSGLFINWPDCFADRESAVQFVLELMSKGVI